MTRLPRIPIVPVARPDETPPEAGFSLIEMAVAMMILTIVMVLVFQSLLWVPDSEARISNASGTSQQLEQAFMTLDGQVRYAADINQPASDGNGNWWVEFESDWTASSKGSDSCTQVEYVGGTGVLQERTWLGTGLPVPAGTAWLPLASNLLTGISTDPFSLSETGPSFTNGAKNGWSLSFTLSAKEGSSLTSQKSNTSFTLTALDITESSLDSGVCGGTP